MGEPSIAKRKSNTQVAKGLLTTGTELKRIELDLLVSGIYQHYGFDFRNYAHGYLQRRVWSQVSREKLRTISGLQDLVLHDKKAMERFLLTLSVNVTSMFRNPCFYLSFRERVVPLLRTYPSIRIWCAGCSTGEEAYSMAILLKEEGLLKKTRIYATDMNELVLNKAKMGIFPLSNMQEYTKNYIESGGIKDFSSYYTAKYENAIFHPDFKKNIVFSKHNLASDRGFNEFNVILCRNVMIYFNTTLQQKVHQIFYNSLCRFGLLGLGDKESIRLSGVEDLYEELDERNKIYQRVE